MQCTRLLVTALRRVQLFSVSSFFRYSLLLLYGETEMPRNCIPFRETGMAQAFARIMTRE